MSYEKIETILKDACQWFYKCTHCHTLLKSLEGGCCVFYSYRTVSCLPIQEAKLSEKLSYCCQNENK
ncbi:GDCCVxC domain-containing (seleno)protein [Proteus vulgaris]|nr:GDCCVxC domain-containing (seleno)protein [Proteus vulgaris]WIF74313.1 GDCCVxC domain-containing (seleno)protein [Proteus vulgaris]